MLLRIFHHILPPSSDEVSLPLPFIGEQETCKEDTLHVVVARDVNLHRIFHISHTQEDRGCGMDIALLQETLNKVVTQLLAGSPLTVHLTDCK